MARPLAGATASSLSLANVQSANAGSYTVTVSNSGGTVTSNVITLTVSQFSFPTCVTIDSAGNLYVGDSTSNTVQKISTANVVSVLAGAPARRDQPMAAAVTRVSTSPLASRWIAPAPFCCRHGQCHRS